MIETSLGNLQAWLKHGETLDEAASTRAAKMLAERYGGDPGSADWRHFGRLAGFTNPRPSRRLASDMQPFARLVEAPGQVYREAAKFIAKVKAAMKDESAKANGGVNDGVGQGASRRRHGLSANEIRAAIMAARDLTKKGSAGRQRDYAVRTAGKALRQTY